MQTQATVTAGGFHPQNVANVLWALATMGERADRGLLEAMQRQATATAGGFVPQAVANVLWALATMGEKADPRLLEEMQTQATATAGEFKPQAVANMLWALATMGERADRGLLEAMVSRATATAHELTPQAFANVLWALATMGERADRGLLEAMVSRATATAHELTPQAFANVLWALAVMGERGLDRTLDVCIDGLAVRVLEVVDELTVEHKSQLHQWLLSCEMGLVSGNSLPSGVARVKQEMGEECLQAFSGQGSCDSRLQREVAAALRRVVSAVDCVIEEEYRDARSGYSIDVLVRRGPAAGSPDGGKSPAGDWAVEVDGPSHFLGDGRTPKGSTLMKRTQLAQLGYTLVAVPFWEWNALKGKEAKRRYIADKLRGGGPEKLSSGSCGVPGVPGLLARKRPNLGTQSHFGDFYDS